MKKNIKNILEYDKEKLIQMLNELNETMINTIERLWYLRDEKSKIEVYIEREEGKRNSNKSNILTLNIKKNSIDNQIKHEETKLKDMYTSRQELKERINYTPSSQQKNDKAL